MRTKIEMDDHSVKQAVRGSGARTKKVLAKGGLRLSAQIHAQTSIRKLRGKVKWEGNLEKSRPDRVTK